MCYFYYYKLFSMSQRIQMNTASLQQSFPEIYQNFFGKNDLVLSWCNIFPWVVWSSLNKICQKVPTKTFCWIKKNQSGTVNLKTVEYFELTDFKKHDFPQINKQYNIIRFPIEKRINDIEEQKHGSK